jgi:hypothetical protein
MCTLALLSDIKTMFRVDLTTFQETLPSHLEDHGQVTILVVPTHKAHPHPIIKLVDMWPSVKRSELAHFQNKFPQFCPVSRHFNH